jgi:hypothetical protein
MTAVPSSVQSAFTRIMNDLDRISREREEIEAKKHPELYRNSQTMERGKSTRYTFFALPTGHGRKGETVRFCYTKHRNVAGYYLSFTQIEGPMRGRGQKRSSTIVQRNFHGWEFKVDAMADCRFRKEDAMKPVEARAFVVPTMKDHFKKKRRARKPVAPPAVQS